MRALNGAIITAAALIGLGLTAQGIGARYSQFVKWHAASGASGAATTQERSPDIEGSHIKFHEMDTALKVCLVTLILAALVGLGITFVGLMYHHHRRYHEHVRLHGPGATTGTHVTH